MISKTSPRCESRTGLNNGIDPELAERGYQDLQQATDRKPFPSTDGLRNVQRLMAQRNPAVGNLKIENLIDARIMRELDESGFIDQLYASYGVK